MNHADPTGHFLESLGALAVFAPQVLLVAAVVAVVVIGGKLLLDHKEEINEAVDRIKIAVETLERKLSPRDQSVYVLKDTQDSNKVKYVGRTNNPTRREAEHHSDPKHPERATYKLEVVATGMTPKEAVVTEQLLISTYTLTYLDNARREIALSNVEASYSYIDATLEIFNGVPEELLQLILWR